MTLEELAGMLEKTEKAQIRRLSAICFLAVIIFRQTGGYISGSVK